MHRQMSLMIGIIGIALAGSAGHATTPPPTGSKTGTVVFVCRYGSAKSVIAARFFNRIAAEEGLPFLAVARGIEPEPVIPPYVREPIRADRFEIGPEEKPVPLDVRETRDAVAVICITCKLPPGQLAVARQSIEWTDVPDVSEGYTAARDRILGHMKELMARLVANTSRLDLAPQSAGLYAISLGLSATFPDDHEMLRHGLVMYDALYAWCKTLQGETHTWPPADQLAS